MDFFQNFGHCITKIKILPDSTEERVIWDKRHSLVGRFECVIDLNFTFSNARDVELQGIEIEATKLHQMFSVVRNLDLRLVNINESLCHFPRLEHLIVPKNWGSADSSLLLLKQTLEVNPQLKHLSIPYCKNWQVFILPNFEEFTMDFDYDGPNSVRDIADFLQRSNNQQPIEKGHIFDTGNKCMRRSG